MVMVPRPDYASRYSLWKELIAAHGGKIGRQDFDLAALAKVSDGYTAGHIVKAVEGVLVERRRLQQGIRPLAPLEFAGVLARYEPVYREEEATYDSWYVKTPMGKRRSKYVEGDGEEGKKEKKKPAKKKKA